MYSRSGNCEAYYQWVWLSLVCWLCWSLFLRPRRITVVTITLAGYTVIQATYAKILPLFTDYWKQQTGQDVTFQELYLASGAQSRAVAGGFEADVVALSLEGDVNRLVDAGLITHDWKANAYGGMISDSLVVLVTAQGQPEAYSGLGRSGAARH